MEHLVKKKQKSRMDVYMEHLKKVSNKEINDLDDQDVLKLLIFKDVNDSGRTLVHKDSCPFLGSTSIENCVDKLRAFEEVGRTL